MGNQKWGKADFDEIFEHNSHHLQNQVIHDHKKRHLENLRLREAERLLGLSDTWEYTHFHVFASFTRKQVWYKVRRNSSGLQWSPVLGPHNDIDDLACRH